MTRYLEIRPGSLSETAVRLRDDYQALFKKELEKSGKSISQMTDSEKKAFFNKIDKMYSAKDEATQIKNPYAVGMAAAMKQTGDKPPLKKSTITKAHDIAKSIEKKEEIKVDEAIEPERITNLQQKIQKMSADMNKLDMSKPDSKTKQAIIKSDLQTAQLRLKDLIQKKTNELSKEVKETKMGYKSFKQSLKKEQEIKDPKKTMTGQPVTKIDVEPKLPTK